MIVVSGNYHDRNAPEKWLMRNKTSPLEHAKAYKAVVAAGVTFHYPSDDEDRFGCSKVAHCEIAHGTNPLSLEVKKGLTHLRFSCGGIVTDDHKQVDACTMLYLYPDGQMYAILPADFDANRKKDGILTEILEEVLATDIVRYSSVREDDEVVGDVNDFALQLAATKARLARELFVLHAEHESITDLYEGEDTLADYGEAKAKLTLISALLDYQLRSQTAVWDERQLVLRDNHRVVVTAQENARYGAELAHRSETLAKLNEQLAGGEPYPKHGPKGLEDLLNAVLSGDLRELHGIDELMGGLGRRQHNPVG